MQKLTFHPAWEKTIAAEDRERITLSFEAMDFGYSNKEIEFTSLSQAKNHRGDLLVIVLIHNTSQQDHTIHDEKISYEVKNTSLAEHTFFLPFTIKKHTSMPWTFIFPSGSLDSTDSFQGGEIRIVS